MGYNYAVNVCAEGAGFEDSIPKVNRAGRVDAAPLGIGIVETDRAISDGTRAIDTSAIVIGVVATNGAVANSALTKNAPAIHLDVIAIDGAVFDHTATVDSTAPVAGITINRAAGDLQHSTIGNTRTLAAFSVTTGGIASNKAVLDNQRSRVGNTASVTQEMTKPEGMIAVDHAVIDRQRPAINNATAEVIARILTNAALSNCRGSGVKDATSSKARPETCRNVVTYGAVNEA